MVANQTFETCTLPQGRLLYRQPDDPAPIHALYKLEDDPRLWLSRAELPQPDRAAGPFEPRDALRAWRLSNVLVPDGSTLMPWQPGILLFEKRSLPAELCRWRKVKMHSLEPSLSHYDERDIAGDPSAYPPRVAWAKREELTVAARSALDAIHAVDPERTRARVGTLKREWNAHPAGTVSVKVDAG